jgi:hypothetical protein
MPPPGRMAIEDVAPERDREEAGSHLPRRIRDKVVTEFMALFPGMPAGRALGMAREFIADPDGFQMKMSQARAPRVTLERLARLMAELPHGAVRPRKVAPRRWAVTSA